jgi:L-arabinose isomerase
MRNHGIHGVQDLCSLLVRNGRGFQLEVGHWEKSDVLDRVAAWAWAAQIALRLRRTRIGRVGEPFRGMGDFAVPPEMLHNTIGVQTVTCSFADLASLLPPADDAEVEAEVAADRARFAAGSVEAEAHRGTVRAGLSVRRWMAREGLTGFTMNFAAIDRASGMPTLPFLEASKAMARGQGYAGEGDVLTAALVSALAAAYPETTFTEMFCPDWEGNSIFLSHMGEWNLNLAAEKPRLIEKPFPWTDAENPIVAVGRFRGGEAALLNLAPMESGKRPYFDLILAPITMLDVDGEDRMSDSIHGWFRPHIPISDFLTDYSNGFPSGTHHLAVVYGEVTRSFTSGVGQFMGIGGASEIGFDDRMATLGDLQELRKDLDAKPKRGIV